jgi:hypothetical protein
MRPEDIETWLRKKPFERFLIQLTAGTAYRIMHPELVVPGRAAVFIGTPPADQPNARYFDRYELVSLLHVMRIIPLEGTAPPTAPELR